MPTTLPLSPSRRGACPTLDSPMLTGDGLLARIRVAGGRMTPAQLEAVAKLIGQYGNGVVEITARGNLQARGLQAEAVTPFARAIREVVAVEAGPVVETPPLAGDDASEIADPRPVAEEIRRLAAPLADGLGPKVTVTVDGNGQIGLGGLKADVGLLAVPGGGWAVSVGGVARGISDAPADCAERVLQRLAALGPAARAADLDTDAVTGLLTGLVRDGIPGEPVAPGRTVGAFALQDGRAFGLALPFGAIAWQAIADLVADHKRFGIEEFRLGPHHTLLAMGGDAAQAGRDFVTDADDPRLRVHACIGNEGCASGHVAARQLGARLAGMVPVGKSLHVSGCAKGCAHPRPADVTLVGRPDGIGLVIAGRAGDTPDMMLHDDTMDTALALAFGAA